MKKINEVYDIINKRSKITADAKTIKATVNLFYTQYLSAALELALVYAKICDQLTGNYIDNAKKIEGNK